MAPPTHDTLIIIPAWNEADVLGGVLQEVRDTVGSFADLVVAFDADPLAAKDPETGLWGYVGWDVGWVVQPAFSDATRMGDNGRALARAA